VIAEFSHVILNGKTKKTENHENFEFSLKISKYMLFDALNPNM